MAIFDQSTLGLAPNSLTFNKYDDPIIYRAERRRVTGRDVRQFDSPLPEISGIADFKTLIGKVDFVIDGEMYPATNAQFEQGRRLLRKIADVANRQLDPLSDKGYVPYVWSETDQNKQLSVKVLFVDLPEDTDNGLVQPFRLFCKVKYPIIKGTTLKIADTGNAAGVVVGAVGYPLLYPVLLGKNSYIIGSAAENQGDAPAYPEVITIVGPVNRPRLTDQLTGEYIEVDANLLTPVDQLIIRYGPDNVSVEVNGVSYYNKVSTSSIFFKIPPGLNNFNLTGSSIGAGASARLSFYDAWPLS